MAGPACLSSRLTSTVGAVVIEADHVRSRFSRRWTRVVPISCATVAQGCRSKSPIARSSSRAADERRWPECMPPYGPFRGISNVSDAHELCQSQSEKKPARTMCTDLTSQTPDRGRASEKAPCASLRTDNPTDGSCLLQRLDQRVGERLSIVEEMRVKLAETLQSDPPRGRSHRQRARGCVTEADGAAPVSSAFA